MLPTRPALYDSPVLKANPFFATLRNVLLNGAVTRPSTTAGPQYNRVSLLTSRRCAKLLIGQKSAAAAITELENELAALAQNRE